MTFKTVSGILAAAVAVNGTVAIGYPPGFSRGDFIPGVDHRMVVNQAEMKSAVGISLSFGATTVTVTNTSGAAWPAGSPFVFQFEVPSSELGQLAIDQKTRMLRVTPWPMRYLDLGSPLALSAAGLRAAAAVAGAGALALIQNFLDVPRALTILSAGNDSGITFTVRGFDVYGFPLTEVITGANAGTAAGKKAFFSGISVTASAAAAGNVSVGWGNVLGLPAYLNNASHIVKEFQDDVAPAAGTTVAGDQAVATGTTGDVRGTYVPNVVPDGTKAYGLLCALPDPGYLGATNFAG